MHIDSFIINIKALAELLEGSEFTPIHSRVSASALAVSQMKTRKENSQRAGEMGIRDECIRSIEYLYGEFMAIADELNELKKQKEKEGTIAVKAIIATDEIIKFIGEMKMHRKNYSQSNIL
ncbi:unnamed protein product [Cercopithifilaria johnstoni]|uniref:Uncharacterized protein n=1 Tax=Cercopithifilaria johnstoni TaxID=2874296 RepID=A0A8J2LZ42_9BILA|nr:unnamed protein product [Cercopithifilaria johnstoni]